MNSSCSDFFGFTQSYSSTEKASLPPTPPPHPPPHTHFVFRKREEEQRRREAVHQVSVNVADKQRVSVARAEQEKLALMNINDSLVETRKSSNDERTKTKEERHKGTAGKFICHKMNK